ncbi:MAG: FecR domain-containing protein [Chthoniobacterales bacterium]
MKKNDSQNHTPSNSSPPLSLLAKAMRYSSLLACLLLPFTSSDAAQLKEARVSQVIKDVNLLPEQAAPRPARVSDEVRNGTAVRTGVESRAELVFTDQTLARLGANTIFSFNEGTRNLQLGGGAMLLRVPKNAGGAQINTAAITAAITGTTVMLEFHPNAYIKFIVLEGTGRIFRNDRVGESVLVHAGQMLIVNPKGKGLPDPVDVDLDRLMKTSELINGFESLPSDGLIAQAILAQTKMMNDGGLIETNLVIFGGGTIVSKLDPTNANAVDQANASGARPLQSTPTPPPITPTPPPITPTPPPITPTPTPMTPTPTPMTPTPTPITPTPPPSKYGTPAPISSPVPYVISSATTIETDPTITTNGVTDYGKIYRGPALDGPASVWLFTATSAFDTKIGLDAFFGTTSPYVPLAALKFLALNLTGNPTISIANGGPTNLALISVGDITSGPPGGTITFSGLDALFLGTQDGSITLTSDLAFQGIPAIGIYARGPDSTLTFDSTVAGTTYFALESEGSILLNNELSVTETNVSGSQLNVSLQSGGDFTASNGLTINLDNSEGGVLNSSTDAQLTTGGNLTANGETGLSLTISNNGAGQISDDASLDVSIGGDLTASAINLLINNRDGGSIGGDGTVSTNVGGALATTGDATFVISDRDDGGGAGTIGGNASVTLTAASANIGGNLIAATSEAAGGQMASALVAINVTGDITTGSGLQFSMQNGGFNAFGVFEGGGTIDQSALASLTATNVTTGDFLTGLITNLNGGQIDGSAALGLALTGNLSSQGDVTFQIDNSTSMGDLFSSIGSSATIGVSVAGNLSANSENGLAVTISNNNNGYIGGEALANVGVGGTLTATTANLLIDNSNGGSIGSAVGLDLLGSQGSIGGDLVTDIANNSGGSILASSALLVSFSGDLSTDGEADFIIENSAISDFGFTIGGNIAQDAAIGLIAQDISTGSGLYTFLYNDGGGHIGGDASIAAAIFGNLTTQSDLFFDIENSADPGQDGTLPGGTIDGDANVAVGAGGNIVSHGVGEFAVLNNDYRFLDRGGTILGDATVDVGATGITTTDFFQPLINNINGTIGGDANLSVIASGDISIGTETYFNILNSNGAIGGDALSNVTANNFTNGNTFEFQILNDGGSIGGNATLTADLAGSLTSTGAATIQITNGGGSIGENASISLTANALSAPSLLAQIDDSGGSIGGDAGITFNISQSLTTTSDATFNIDLTPQGHAHAGNNQPATIGTIDFNGGSYDVGGTLLATIVGGDGGITIGTASMHADIVKIGAFGDNGSLTIGGGSISGDTLLKLYAPGSNGMIDFVSNVTLNSNSSVLIAGNTVTVHNGVLVTITGDDGVRASVYTNVPNYTGSGGNGTTTGMFAGNGATTQPLDQAPPFGPATPDTPAKGSTTSIATAAPTPATNPGLPGNGGSGADTVVHRVRPHVAIARVADSNELLDLADKAAAAPTQTGRSKSNTPTGRTAHNPISALPANGRPLSPRPNAASEELTLNQRGGGRPASLP